MYGAYLIEIYRYLSEPIIVNNNQQKKIFITIFMIGVCAMIGLAHILKEMVLPLAIFNLIVVTLQILLIVPLSGAIIPDYILSSNYNTRLPGPIKLAILIITGSIAYASIVLMLFSPLSLIERITNTLSYAIDLISLLFIGLIMIGALIYLYRQIQARQK